MSSNNLSNLFEIFFNKVSVTVGISTQSRASTNKDHQALRLCKKAI
jgi:hypothetical protein